MEPRLIASILIQLSAPLQVYSLRCKQAAPSIYRRATTRNSMTFFFPSLFAFGSACEQLGVKLALSFMLGWIFLLYATTVAELSEMSFDLLFVLREQNSLQIALRYSVLDLRKGAFCEERGMTFYFFPPPSQFKRRDQSPLEQGQPHEDVSIFRMRKIVMDTCIVNHDKSFGTYCEMNI